MPFDSWGVSWGNPSAWGVSWVHGDQAPVVVPDAARGHVPWLGGGAPLDRERIAKDRERFGIPRPVIEIIEAIAEGQAARLEADEQKRFEELSREMQLRGIEWEAQFLEIMNATRQRLIDAEIGRLLRQQLEDEQIMLMLIAASL